MGYLVKPFGSANPDNKIPNRPEKSIDDIDRIIRTVTRKIRLWMCDLDFSESGGVWISEFKKSIRLDSKNTPLLAEEHVVNEIITQLPNLLRLRDALCWTRDHFKGAKIEECHPTQSESKKWRADLVLKYKSAYLCFEITDSKSPFSNRKLRNTINKFIEVQKRFPSKHIEFFVVAPNTWLELITEIDSFIDMPKKERSSRPDLKVLMNQRYSGTSMIAQLVIPQAKKVRLKAR